MLAGIASIGVGLLLWWCIYWIHTRIGRAAFNRSNRHGVQEFDSYGSAERSRIFEHLFRALLGPGLFIAGVVAIIFGVVLIQDPVPLSDIPAMLGLE